VPFEPQLVLRNEEMLPPSSGLVPCAQQFVGVESE